MPTPQEIPQDSQHGGTLLPTEDRRSDQAVIGFWWSDQDFAWWPVYLGEVREASGQPNMTLSTAWDWASVNIGPLRMSVPRDKGRPGDDSYIYPGSGRAAAPRGGGGRGGAGAKPQEYVGPDRAAVEEIIRSYVVATTGTVNQGTVNAAVDAYLAADRQSFDLAVAGTAGTDTDPMMAAKQVVRGTSDYNIIHELRPESVDEMEWVTSRQGKLRQLGLSAQQSERLGIKQAQVGANDEALIDAGEMQFNADTGRMLQSQKETLKQSGRAALGLV